jgi:hypothetical protein
VTPGNRDAIIGNLIRFSKLTEKASFSRATADGKGIETGEGTEAEAYYESLKAMPAAFSRETVAKSSTARTAGDTTAAERIESPPRRHRCLLHLDLKIAAGTEGGDELPHARLMAGQQEGGGIAMLADEIRCLLGAPERGKPYIVVDIILVLRDPGNDLGGLPGSDIGRCYDPVERRSGSLQSLGDHRGTERSLLGETALGISSRRRSILGNPMADKIEEHRFSRS